MSTGKGADNHFTVVTILWGILAVGGCALWILSSTERTLARLAVAAREFHVLHLTCRGAGGLAGNSAGSATGHGTPGWSGWLPAGSSLLFPPSSP